MDNSKVDERVEQLLNIAENIDRDYMSLTKLKEGVDRLIKDLNQDPVNSYLHAVNSLIDEIIVDGANTKNVDLQTKLKITSTLRRLLS